jgi:phage recombination protein Bet
MSNELATIEGFERKEVDLIKKTVAQGATDDELKMFLYLANAYKLDPFKKEIWFLRIDGRPTIFTSRDGYLKIAQDDENYDGLQAFAVCEGDVFEIDAENWKITHKFGAKRGKLQGAWAVAYHKQRKPMMAFVNFDEYNDPIKKSWKKYPSAMIMKVAEVAVLKRQFNISGLVTQEEMKESEVEEPKVIIRNVEQLEPITKDMELPEETEQFDGLEEIDHDEEYRVNLIDTIRKTAKKAKITSEDNLLTSLFAVTGYDSLGTIDTEDAQLFLNHLQNIVNLFKFIKEKNIDSETLSKKVTKKSYEMNVQEIAELLEWAENYGMEMVKV